MSGKVKGAKSVRQAWIVAQVRERTKWLVGNNPEKQYQLDAAIKAAIAEKAPGRDFWFREDEASAAVELAVAFVEASVHRRVGREEHPAKETYKARYRKHGGRGGLSMEEVQALIRQEFDTAPDPKTIRKWEKEVEGE